MSHWDQAPFVAVCVSCTFHVEAISAGTLDVALAEHSRVWGHHQYAISEA